MSIAALITQSQLEMSMGGPDQLRMFTDDDGDGIADPEPVNWIIEAATHDAAGILRAGWNAEQVVALVNADPAVRNHVLAIAKGFAGERRPQLTDPNGKMLFAALRDTARGFLQALAATQLRSIEEGLSVAANSKTNPKTNVTRPVEFTFAGSPTGGREPPGGM